MLSGASVDVLCEHNAQVSEGAKRFQVAEAWVSTILFSSLKVDSRAKPDIYSYETVIIILLTRFVGRSAEKP